MPQPQQESWRAENGIEALFSNDLIVGFDLAWPYWVTVRSY
jgi:hypothetical protein